MNEEELKKQAESFLGNWVWLFVSGVALLLFKSTIESVVESIKIFAGKDLNTDDVVILDGRPPRVIRCGFWKCKLL